MDQNAWSLARGLAKPSIIFEGSEETREPAEATTTRQGFLHDHGFTSEWLIIRQLPDRWFKSSPRNPISRRMAAAYGVYVLQNSEGKFYIGLSDDVPRRSRGHNNGQSRWTKGRGPWSVLWQSQKQTLTEARKLENRLKRQGRGKGFYTITGLHRRGS